MKKIMIYSIALIGVYAIYAGQDKKELSAGRVKMYPAAAHYHTRMLAEDKKKSVAEQKKIITAKERDDFFVMKALGYKARL